MDAVAVCAARLGGGQISLPYEHRFGGPWTDEKLEAVRKYLQAYRTIFAANRQARHFRTIYVDAFAGSGYRSPTQVESDESLSLFGDPDAEAFRKGSAVIALETDPPFHEYIFVEKDPVRAAELETLKREFPALSGHINVIPEEANTCLRKLCRETDWNGNRAVVFLDPYGMSVDWSTIEALAATRGVDLWYLFPLGQGVNRLLTKTPPTGALGNRLTRIFGTSEWKAAFYDTPDQGHLFGEEGGLEKVATFETIGDFLLQRLRTAFPHVAPNPRPLLNSKNSPIYLLAFAASNPKGGPTAVKIASHILGKERHGN